MEIILDGGPTYSMMVRELRSRKLESFDAMRENLNSKRSQSKIIRAARESGLAKDERLKTMACVFDDATYCGTVIEILSDELPLMNMEMEDCWDDDGNYVIGINPNSFSMITYDDACDDFDNVSSADPLASLMAFLLLLNLRDEQEYWDGCIEHFNWPFDRELIQDWTTPIDDQFLKRTLKKRGLECLYLATEQALFPPDNLFLTCNPEDSDSIYYECTGKNIKLLRREWKKAEPYLEAFHVASMMVAEDPGLLKILYEGIIASQESSKKKSDKPGTFLERIHLPKDVIPRTDEEPEAYDYE